MRKGLAVNLLLGVFIVSVYLSPGVTYAAGRGSDWKLVYEHDENGNSISGSLQRLVDAINRGADVKVSVGWASGWSIYIPYQVGFAQNGTIVALKCRVYRSTIDNSGYPVLVEDEKIAWNFKTDGTAEHITYNASETTIIEHAYENIRMKWFVNY